LYLYILPCAIFVSSSNNSHLPGPPFNTEEFYSLFVNATPVGHA
jgi:hypothetical protein